MPACGHPMRVMWVTAVLRQRVGSSAGCCRRAPFSLGDPCSSLVPALFLYCPWQALCSVAPPCSAWPSPVGSVLGCKQSTAFHCPLPREDRGSNLGWCSHGAPGSAPSQPLRPCPPQCLLPGTGTAGPRPRLLARLTLGWPSPGYGLLWWRLGQPLCPGGRGSTPGLGGGLQW